VTPTTYKPKPESWSETYSQDTDTWQPSNEGPQTLSLEALESEGGHYIVLKTERWAIDPDEIDGFAEHLKKFIHRT